MLSLLLSIFLLGYCCYRYVEFLGSCILGIEAYCLWHKLQVFSQFVVRLFTLFIFKIIQLKKLLLLGGKNCSPAKTKTPSVFTLKEKVPLKSILRKVKCQLCSQPPNDRHGCSCSRTCSWPSCLWCHPRSLLSSCLGDYGHTRRVAASLDFCWDALRAPRVGGHGLFLLDHTDTVT